MTRIIEFPIVKRSEAKVQKVISIPNLFANLFEAYKKKQHDLRQKKIKFLHQQAYQYYYDLLEVPKYSGVDIPEFITEKQRQLKAHDLACRALLDVIKDKRVNECYTFRVNELKRIQGEVLKKKDNK